LAQFFTEWDKYLNHIEQTGRKQQSQQNGLVDSSPPSHSSSALSKNGHNNHGFGRDVSRDVVFNEEQESQLGKLKEEAKRAGAGKD
jgi:hypothetical protein